MVGYGAKLVKKSENKKKTEKYALSDFDEDWLHL